MPNHNVAALNGSFDISSEEDDDDTDQRSQRTLLKKISRKKKRTPKQVSTCWMLTESLFSGSNKSTETASAME